jgi:hypothetical protein
VQGRDKPVTLIRVRQVGCCPTGCVHLDETSRPPPASLTDRARTDDPPPGRRRRLVDFRSLALTQQYLDKRKARAPSPVGAESKGRNMAMRIGYKASADQFPPQELVEYAVRFRLGVGDP